MPKEMAINSNAEEALARTSATESERNENAALEEAEETAKRADAAALRAENKKLAELEAAEIEKAGKNPDKKAIRVPAPVPKLTGADLERRREEDAAEESNKKQRRTADEEECQRVVLVSNTNRGDPGTEARPVKVALTEILIGEWMLPPPTYEHPERRPKPSFKEFEEAELAKLKEEKPGLALSQYNDMIWTMWEKSPVVNQLAEWSASF